MRKTFVVLGALAAMSCDPAGKPADDGRVEIIPAPGAGVIRFTADGRAAFTRYAGEGKMAVYVANSDFSNPKRVSFGLWDISPSWSPDGKWIAFDRDMGGQNDVVLIPADSGAERVVASTGANEVVSSWTPDGSALLFHRLLPTGAQIWEFRVADGTTSRPFEIPGSTFGISSRDGKSIIYNLGNNGKSHVWIWDRATRQHRQLTTDGFEAMADHMGLSPDGRTLLYRSFRTGVNDIWSLDLASGKSTQLTRDIAGDYSPRWSPDGTRILFLSDRGGQRDVWMMSKGEEDVQRVTDDVAIEAGAIWSFDGKSALVSVPTVHSHLASAPVAGGPMTALTSGEWDVNEAIMSRDRTTVVFSMNRAGDNDIWAMPSAGGTPHLVAGGPGHEGAASMPYDNSQVAFQSPRSGNDDIWIAPIAGGSARQLTTWPTSEGGPRFSPDGKWVAFYSNRGAPQNDLWIVAASGGEPRRLTTRGGIGDATWTPDSRQILILAAAAKGASGSELLAIDVATGTERLIASASILAYSVSRSGKEIAASRCIDGQCRYEVRSIDGKLLRQLTANDVKFVFEYNLRWTENDSTVAISYQEFGEQLSYPVDVRSAAGAVKQRIAPPPGVGLQVIGFSPDDKNVIVMQVPNGGALVQVPLPPAAKR
jgi:Tol biopolymer transport system component